MHTTPTETPEPFPREPIPPELLAWARQTFDIQEFMDGVREIKATGGKSFESLIAIEERLSAAEAAVAELRRRLPVPPSGWLERVIGSQAGEPAFQEVLALGRAACEADQPTTVWKTS